MDKILFIDMMNAIWRGNVTFGPPVQHQQCISECQHKDSAEEYHCQCGSPWNPADEYCYGDKYLVVFNFFRNLRPIIEDFAPDKCFVVMEGHPQFRYDLYADYKANRIIKRASRAEAQEKVSFASEIILSLLPHLPLTLARAERFEADDTIATLADNLQLEDLTILSADTDFMQLLQRGYPQIQIYNPIKKSYMEAPEYPYLCWKILNGDKSDNIPALLKPKKAIATASDPELLKKFLEIEENRANFAINRKLIEFGVVPAEEIQIQEGHHNFQFLYDAFSQMKFNSITRDYAWKRYQETFDCLKY